VTSATLAYVLAAAYPLWLAAFLRLRERRTSAGLLSLTLPPMLLTGAAAWIGYAHVAQGERGGMQPILATIAFGTISSGVCAAIALFAVARTRYDAIGATPRAPIVIAVLCFALTAAAIAMADVIEHRDAFTMWNVSLVAAFVALTLLVPVAVIAIAGQQRVASRRAQLVMLATALGTAVALTVIALRFAHV